MKKKRIMKLTSFGEEKISTNPRCNTYQEVSFLDEHCKQYYTYVSPEYENYPNWKPILDAGKGAEFYFEKLKIKKNKTRLNASLVNADCIPVLMEK